MNDDDIINAGGVVLSIVSFCGVHPNTASVALFIYLFKNSVFSP